MFGFENPFKSNTAEAPEEKRKNKSSKRGLMAAGVAAALSVGAASAHADEAIDAMFAAKADAHTEHIESADSAVVSQKYDEETGQTLEQLIKKNAAENAANLEHNKKVRSEKSNAGKQMAAD